MIPTLWKQTKDQVLKRALQGAPRKFEGPEDLLEACIGYFEWCEKNFVSEEVLVSFQGITSKETKARPSAMLLSSLQLWIGVDRSTWAAWRTERPDLSSVLDWVEQTIYDQKFKGAASGAFNANIIMRDLGLADKAELTGKDGGPIESMTIDPSKLSTGALKEILAARANAESDDS